nr:BREX system Lon protease-like protein BrxL [Candidatus Sigynarchaeota archaeon]
MTVQLPPLDPLDLKLKEYFATRIVRKSYAAQVHAFSKLPRFISEYLISLHADENGSLPDDARDKIIADLEKFYPDKADKEQLKSLAMELGSVDIIGHFEVVTDLRRHRYTTLIESLSERATVDSILIGPKFHPDLLRGGMWGKASFQYVPRGDVAFLNMNAFESMQDQKPVLKKFIDARDRFSTDEWLDTIIKTIGLEPASLDHETKMLYIARMICLVERSYDVIEMGPPQTGKTHVFENLTSHARVVLGGDITLAKLVYNLTTRENGIIFNYDVVCFDEINKPKSSMDDLVPKLQQIMASNKIERGDMYTTTDVSLVFQGNVFGLEQSGNKTVPRSAVTLKDIPRSMQDAAFLDRVHAYIHGWKFPRLAEGNINMKLGIISNYFSEIMHKLRNLDYSDIVQKNYHFFKINKDGTQEPISLRDYVAVKKTIAGFLKLLYPNKKVNLAEMQEIGTIAVELRQNAIDELKIYDPALYRAIGFELRSGKPDAAQPGLALALPAKMPPVTAQEARIEPTNAQEVLKPAIKPVEGLYTLGTIIASMDCLLAKPIPYWYLKLLVAADALELQGTGAKIKKADAAGFTIVKENAASLRLDTVGSLDFNVLEDGLKDASNGIAMLKGATEDLSKVLHRLSVVRGNI